MPSTVYTLIVDLCPSSSRDWVMIKLPFSSIRESFETLAFVLNAGLFFLDTILDPACVEIVFGYWLCEEYEAEYQNEDRNFH
jgi:hypothetical protein